MAANTAHVKMKLIANIKMVQRHWASTNVVKMSCKRIVRGKLNSNATASRVAYLQVTSSTLRHISLYDIAVAVLENNTFSYTS